MRAGGRAGTMFTMSDITTRLRQTRANLIGTDDEEHYFDCHEAAGEIERLRSLVRFQDAVIRSGDVACLTEAERALLAMLADHPNTHDLFPEDLRTLRGLLERMPCATAGREGRK